jgi:hypothetical protein
MTHGEIEEVILALRAAGMACPEYEVLPDGSYHFFNGQKIQDFALHIPESGSDVG